MRESKRARLGRTAELRWIGAPKSEVAFVVEASVTHLIVAAESEAALGARLLVLQSTWPEGVPPLLAEVVAARGHGSHWRLEMSFVDVSSQQLKALAGHTGADAVRADALFCFTTAEQLTAAHPHAFLVERDDVSQGDQVVIGASCLVFFVRGKPGGAWDPVSVGRDETCDLRIDHTSISRQHALFERSRQTGEYILCDRGSRNGTRVNGLRLPPDRVRTLTSQCVVEFGTRAFWFLSPADVFRALARSAPQREL